LQKLNVKMGLKRFFDYDSYREYAGESLQEKAANSAIHGKSILVLFPTGGGKSIAFQVPALMSGENERGLTVVISPLQSLMKDQVDNLEKLGITSATTINFVYLQV
jgi:ATP-dependent DNA helicase RecQ